MFYKPLVNIAIHHAYFLDEGEDRFKNMDAEEQELQLRNYVLKDYLRVVPSLSTQQQLKDHRLLYQQQQYGIQLLAGVLDKEVLGVTKYYPQIPLDDDLEFTFELWATDPHFDNYTQLTSKDNNRLYLFTNIEPSTEDPGYANVFTENGTVDASFLVKSKTARRLVYDMLVDHESLSGKPSQQLVSAIDPDDLDEAEIKEQLHSHIQKLKRKGFLGFIQLRIKGDSAQHLLAFDGADQYIKDITPSATISFRNRKTFWRYIETKDGVSMTTTSKKPLTKNGFVEIEDADLTPFPMETYAYPNPGVALIKKENNKYYSEIFI